ncbi:MAG TPA: glutamine-hydrolyzing carbamoyl-phosphate synthase small subunit [Coxiellaceae bacterium]|nr:MAG: carbamoyl phosphate synthase small subunit [Gammaproteobacteria bacterium RIFCSPHIGHO2_12_FULL_36_30]HLB56985.1 glutamine-hydrolyzing carbamoyl-phosphate synthase small subunit [Coxiellaceae bacterium]
MSIENFLSSAEPATLALADGSLFQGISIGASGETVGEVVFNTAMTGYQEILTDPSYSQQIITFTYPHIGNTGINSEDNESKKIFAAGLIIRELSPIVSNWRATESLPDFLKKQNIIAIANMDTRRLTHILREKGAQGGCIITGKINPDVAIKKAKAFSGLNGKDLAIEVSTKNKYEWTHLTPDRVAIEQMEVEAPATTPRHVVVLDFGVKTNILRLLSERNCKVTVVPAKTSAEEILKLNPDGVVLSNGPGDPAACDYAIETTKKLIAKKIPLFGICLGFQILALAFGAKTKKMKFGHHGANHPVQELKTKKVFITSQNHGFCVDEKTLPEELIITHISLFDKTLQGFKHKTLPVIAFQGHPEAAPGPNDIVNLFDEFLRV